MKKWKIQISWYEPQDDIFFCDAETEDEAIDKIIEENPEIGEDYSIDRVICEGETPPLQAIEEVDPNQMKFSALAAYEKGEI